MVLGGKPVRMPGWVAPGLRRALRDVALNIRNQDAYDILYKDGISVGEALDTLNADVDALEAALENQVLLRIFAVTHL